MEDGKFTEAPPGTLCHLYDHPGKLYISPNLLMENLRL